MEDRETGEQKSVVGNQLAEGLKDIALDDLRRCIIAYEPVWAIGTGKTAAATMLIGKLQASRF